MADLTYFWDKSDLLIVTYLCRRRKPSISINSIQIPHVTSGQGYIFWQFPPPAQGEGGKTFCPDWKTRKEFEGKKEGKRGKKKKKKIPLWSLNDRQKIHKNREELWRGGGIFWMTRIYTPASVRKPHAEWGEGSCLPSSMSFLALYWLNKSFFEQG